MKIYKHLVFIPLISLLLLIKGAEAQGVLQYPVAELGYCRDAKECYLYCEIPRNYAACWSYGKFVLKISEDRVLSDQVISDKGVEEKAKALGITFPVAELGNCGSVGECRSYCEDPLNREACVEFGRKYGIGRYKRHKELVEKAREELGCSTYRECRRFCADPANRDRCMRFAEENMPEEVREKKLKVLQKAKETLGCNSYESCREFCEKPSNRASCAEFGRRYVPKIIKKYMEGARFPKGRGSGGEGRSDDSRIMEERGRTKVKFPEDMEDKYREKLDQYIGPACSTESECSHYCEENPGKCPGYEEGYYKKYEGDDYDDEIEDHEEYEDQLEDYSYEDDDYDDDYPDNKSLDYEEEEYPLENMEAACSEKGCVWDESSSSCDCD